MAPDTDRMKVEMGADVTSARDGLTAALVSTVVLHITSELKKRYPDNSPGEWAVVEETIAILRALPVKQRMAIMGMEPCLPGDDLVGYCGEHFDGKHWVEQ